MIFGLVVDQLVHLFLLLRLNESLLQVKIPDKCFLRPKNKTKMSKLKRTSHYFVVAIHFSDFLGFGVDGGESRNQFFVFVQQKRRELLWKNASVDVEFFGHVGHDVQVHFQKLEKRRRVFYGELSPNWISLLFR